LEDARVNELIKKYGGAEGDKSAQEGHTTVDARKEKPGNTKTNASIVGAKQTKQPKQSKQPKPPSSTPV
jgi:hypothetical protein